MLGLGRSQRRPPPGMSTEPFERPFNVSTTGDDILFLCRFRVSGQRAPALAGCSGLRARCRCGPPHTGRSPPNKLKVAPEIDGFPVLSSQSQENTDHSKTMVIMNKTVSNSCSSSSPGLLVARPRLLILAHFCGTAPVVRLTLIAHCHHRRLLDTKDAPFSSPKQVPNRGSGR